MEGQAHVVTCLLKVPISIRGVYSVPIPNKILVNNNGTIYDNIAKIIIGSTYANIKRGYFSPYKPNPTED